MSRGLKFTPSPENNNKQEIESDMSEFFRRIKLKEFFHDKNYEQDDSLVRNKSSFEPSKGRNAALDEFITRTKNFPLSSLPTEKKYNITLDERNALTSLQNDPTIIIKEADKGNGIVIMNTSFYRDKMLEMLANDSFYKTTNDTCSKTTFKKIRNLIKLAKDITRHEIAYLLEFDFKSSNFYGLPKIHKSNLIKNKCIETQSEYLELKDPIDLQFRPIIAGPVCETHRLSNLIDILLKPFIKQVKSFIRDDIDFLSYTPNIVPEKATLVSFDVTSLYTNISHDLGLEAIQFWLEKHPELIHKRFTKEFIMEGIKTIIENNNFMFDGCFYNQIRGTAMGTKFAPTYATLVLAYLEEKLYTRLEDVNKDLAEYVKGNWKRFLDDCFIIWVNSEEELTEFHETIDNLHSDIKFTIEKSKKQLPFLDILLVKTGTQLKTDIYFKVTDTKKYLNFYSCHPRHTKKSIPYNLARRVCTVVSDEKTEGQKVVGIISIIIKKKLPQTIDTKRH